MSIELNTFLDDYITDDKFNATHCTSIDTNNGQIYYNIPNNKVLEFYSIYNNAYIQNVDLYMGEIHKDYGPILIDIDFKYKSDEDNLHSDIIINKLRKYDVLFSGNDTITMMIVKIYMKIIKKYLHVEKKNIQCFVLEKKEPYWNDEKNIFSDGLHLIFPFICIPVYFQKFIRVKFIKYAKEINLFNNLNLVYMANTIVDQVIDRHTISDINWRLYGSKKFGSNYPYLLSKIYNNNLELLSINEYESFDLIYLLSIRKFSQNSITELNNKFIENFSISNNKIPNHNKIYTLVVIFCIIIFFIYINDNSKN